MKRCEFCGMDLPVNSHFCGGCGRLLPDEFVSATDITYAPQTDIPAPQTPPLFSSPSYPNLQDTGMGWQDKNTTLRTNWSTVDMENVNQQFINRKTDENETVIPDLLLPGMLAMQGQPPSPLQTPMVQATPQIGGVPSVHGTPAALGNVPPSVPVAHGAGSSAPSYAPQEPQVIPSQQQPVHYPMHESTPDHYQSVHHSQSTSPSHELKHQHHRTGPLRDHKSQASKIHRSATVTSKTGMGVVSKWLIVVVAAVVVIATSSVLLTHAFVPTNSPSLSIGSTNAVRDGGILNLHGRGFQPGGSITLTIDKGVSVSLYGQQVIQNVSRETARNANITDVSQMSIARALESRSTSGTNITVSSSGTFDANPVIPISLQPGNHTIHAIENPGAQTADLQFTVSSSQLAVNPTALNFGSVEVGRTVKLLITLSNQGELRLPWTATVDGSNMNWLTLQNSSGAVEAKGSQEAIIVAANTNGLSLGLHSAKLLIHSDTSDVQVAVELSVIPVAQSGQQANLNVTQQNLDFGQLQTGQQVQQSVSIANLGNLPLKWQATTDAASASWLSLVTKNGTVQPGAVPQTVQVNVNTTSLAAGSHSGMINIASNGGNATVKVTLSVIAATPTPTPTTPTPSPTTPTTLAPTVTSISPAGGPAVGGTHVTITGTGFTGATNVTFGQTAASNIVVKSDTQIIAASPVGSGKIDVTVTTPGGTSATSSADLFIYNVVTPTWSVSPTSLNSSACGVSASCTVTLMEDANSTGNINWTPGSDVGATFSPPNGTLSPGANGQQQVSISGMACHNGTITFTGSAGVKQLTVPWSCVPPPTPKITVAPQNIGSTSSNCKQNSDGTYNCSVTVGETSPGDLNWFAPTGIGGTGGSFNPSNGQLTASQTQQPVVISSISCNNATFTFTDRNNNTATVTWNCTPPPPTQQPSPTQPPSPTATVNPIG